MKNRQKRHTALGSLKKAATKAIEDWALENSEIDPEGPEFSANVLLPVVLSLLSDVAWSSELPRDVLHELLDNELDFKKGRGP